MTVLARTRAELDAFLAPARREERRVGLVLTMGALHAGHRALLERAVAENDLVVATIYVNPLQFGDARDLERYPRNLETDLALLEETGTAVCFAPSDAEMYPSAPVIQVDPGPLGETLEGAFRPGHFRGVATVVTKLFAIVGAARSYFGEKDYQQLRIVDRLVTDLSLPIEVVACPTVRNERGLALSSRNARLSPIEREAALVLIRALQVGRSLVEAGEAKPSEIEEEMAAIVTAEPLAQLDYAVVRVASTLEVSSALEGTLRLLVAAHVGAVRLIDNLAAST